MRHVSTIPTPLVIACGSFAQRTWAASKLTSPVSYTANQFESRSRKPTRIGEVSLMRPNERHGICGFQRRWVDSTLLGLILAITLARPSVGAEIAPTEALAEVNGEAITAGEVERGVSVKLSQLEQQIYSLKRQELDALITQRLLAQEAARRAVSVAALLDAEVTSKIDLVTDKEV